MAANISLISNALLQSDLAPSEERSSFFHHLTTALTNIIWQIWYSVTCKNSFYLPWCFCFLSFVKIAFWDIPSQSSPAKLWKSKLPERPHVGALLTAPPNINCQPCDWVILNVQPSQSFRGLQSNRKSDWNCMRVSK